jgi:hypothetical protein
MCFCNRKNINQNLVVEPKKVTHEQSPELTPDEIIVIQTNLDSIIVLSKEINSCQLSIINEVQNNLNSKNILDISKNVYLEYYIKALQTIGIIIEDSDVEIASVILGGIYVYVTNDSSVKTTIPLETTFDSLERRIKNTYEVSQTLLTQIYDDPNEYRDLSLSIPGKNSRTVRDLIDCILPLCESEIFKDCIKIASRQFRRNVTISEMIKMQSWDIYYVEDNMNTNEFGFAYTPIFGTIGDYQKSKEYSSITIGNEKEIMTNDEIIKYHTDYTKCTGMGNNNNDLSESYLYAMNSFISKFPVSIIYPWTITDASVYSCKWHIINSENKIDNGSSKFNLANNNLMKWLFIDDGFGNVLNPDGVIYRVDLLTSGIVSYGKNIPAQNIYPISENVISNSSMYHYRYPGKHRDNKVNICFEVEKIE